MFGIWKLAQFGAKKPQYQTRATQTHYRVYSDFANVQEILTKYSIKFHVKHSLCDILYSFSMTSNKNTNELNVEKMDFRGTVDSNNLFIFK